METKIYIPSKYGQHLPLEVMDGLIRNNSVPIVISSNNDKEDIVSKNKNVFDNTKIAIQVSSGDRFICMDRDIILPDNSILELNNLLDTHEFVYFFSRPGQAHGLWGINKKLLKDVPFDVGGDYSSCPICTWKDRVAVKTLPWPSNVLLTEMRNI